MSGGGSTKTQTDKKKVKRGVQGMQFASRGSSHWRIHEEVKKREFGAVIQKGKEHLI